MLSWLDLRKWKKPTRHELSSLHVANQSRELQRQFQSQLDDRRISNLSIEFDHWRDLRGRSIFGFVASWAGHKQLLDLRHVSLVGHSSESIISFMI